MPILSSARWVRFACIGLSGLSFDCRPVRAEDGYELWLRYRPEPDTVRRTEYALYGRAVVIAESRPMLVTARQEALRALTSIVGDRREDQPLADGTIYLGQRGDADAIAALVSPEELAGVGPEGFIVRVGRWRERRVLVVAGENDAGVLYGIFRLLREMQLGTPLDGLDVADAPRLHERLANHWDNPVRVPGFHTDSVERGYAGHSIFNWDELPGRLDPRLCDWARLLAAMGLNGVVVNNVNTAAKPGFEGWRLLTAPYLPKLATLAGLLRRFGVRLFVSVNFFSPVLIDQLATADPCDPTVRKWWRAKADEIYAAIPGFGGFLVKADSEGEPGPMKYGRTHADGANMLAAALAPHGGAVHWRAFVYNRALGDRVTQAYANFTPLDGQFAANVLVQIKNGPLDFQVREPVSSLLGAMPRTNQLLEMQVTQEYTGQDRHVCFLAPMWREVLAFDTHARGPGSTVSRLLRDRLNPGTRNGVAGVMNIGDARNWTGHLLAQANTYAFGRLAWDPDLSPSQIANEWAQLTFGRDPRVVAVVSRILLASWRAYEDYTAPLGLGLLARRGDHFVPDPANRADYHGGDANGVGFDRTVATGSGYAGQYFEPWRSRYEALADCPEELLLFFHHVPYTHRLTNANTVIQEIYDRHFDGVTQAREFVSAWMSLRGLIDGERHAHVLARLRDQVTLAEEWCRVVNGYFAKLSGIPDNKRSRAIDLQGRDW